MSREGALWIGGLEPYMDEEFLMGALAAMGETQIHSVKVLKNKFTNMPASYGFINFDSDPAALMAMHKLNGKIIPNSQPPVRFKLNHQTTRMMPGEKDNSIWVGDLTAEVDDYQLFKFFSARFQSVKSARVILDSSGFSKGYGFVRFGNEQEQETALHSMQGIPGLGSKPLKVKEKAAVGQQRATSTNPAAPSTGLTDSLPPSALAMVVSSASGNPKAGMAVVQEAQAQAWQAYSEQYWQQYANWGQYNQTGYADSNNHAAVSASAEGAYASSQECSMPDYSVPPPPLPTLHIDQSGPEWYGYKDSIFEGDELELAEHSLPVSVEKENDLFLKRSEELWTASDEAAWDTISEELLTDGGKLSAKNNEKQI